MGKITTAEIKQLFSHVRGHFDDSVLINEVFTDSRNQVTDGLFVPIIGDNFDGHDFIIQAIENGAKFAFWGKKEIDPHIPDDFPLILVEDTIEALQKLASFYRDKVNPKVIGITGSNGKTTTKELIYEVLKTKYHVTKTIGNLNNHIGLPLSILKMDLNCEMLVLEMGMNHFGEIERLSQIAKPDIAVITNIGESHIEFLKSREGIAKAKLEIVSGLNNLGRLIVDGDEPLLNVDLPYEVVTCGFHEANDVYVYDIKQQLDQTTFYIENQLFTIPLLGEHQAKNSAFAYAVGRMLDISVSEINEALKTIQFKLMRFEQIKLNENVTIINDAYNASPTSMIASINVLKNMPYKHKVLVLADILELGTFSETEHKKVGKSIDEQIDAVYTYGSDSKHITDGISEHIRIETKHFVDRDKIVSAIKERLKENTVILFKGSRAMKLEEIIEEIV